MAGNRQRFEAAIQRANDYVWAEEWTNAIKVYRRALAEFPNDTSALLGYAWSLFNAEEDNEALKVYTHLTKVVPDDPGPYERLGELLERREEPEEATAMYIQAAELYSQQSLTDQQLNALEKAVRNTPEDIQSWGELLKLYKEAEHDVEGAILAAYWLSYLYQNEHYDWAVEVCRQMETFVPREPRIIHIMQLLQSGQMIPEPPPVGSRVPTPDEIDAEAAGATGEQGSPTEQARKKALEDLAQSIFADNKPEPQGISDMEVAMLISQAVDAQSRGDLSAAQEAYQRLLQAGVSMPSIHFNLGLIYKEQMRFDEAIPQFEQSLSDSEYGLGSNYALGESYQAQGKFELSLKYFLEALKIVDLNTVQREQTEDLLRVYESMAQSLVNAGEPERVEQLSQTLVGFLGQRGWEDEARQARKRLDGLARSGAVLSLAEVISLPNSENILRSVALAQEYMRRGKAHEAIEELMYAIGMAPLYLPLHHLLGSFMIENENLDTASDKFRTIARVYEIRDQMSQALATYRQILELSPLDIKVRSQVIELLIKRGQIDDALEQYLLLADAYYQLADTERARETYAEALKMAPRGSKVNNWDVRILHRIADMDMQRLDWHAAIRSYEKIIRISAEDERAYISLMRLYPRVGRAPMAINILDKLLRNYLQARKAQKALALLEELIQDDPENIALRGRIAQLSLNMGQKDKAMEHLDILGDLQLEAGDKEAAAKTIESIIALKPPNVEAYADLYREMTGRDPSTP